MSTETNQLPESPAPHFYSFDIPEKLVDGYGAYKVEVSLSTKEILIYEKAPSIEDPNMCKYICHHLAYKDESLSKISLDEMSSDLINRLGIEPDDLMIYVVGAIQKKNSEKNTCVKQPTQAPCVPIPNTENEDTDSSINSSPQFD